MFQNEKLSALGDSPRRSSIMAGLGAARIASWRGDHAEAIRGYLDKYFGDIGHDYVPGTCDISVLDEVVTVNDRDSFALSRRLAREEGIFVGMSSGAAMKVAMDEAARLGSGQVVTLLPDGGIGLLYEGGQRGAYEGLTIIAEVDLKGQQWDWHGYIIDGGLPPMTEIILPEISLPKIVPVGVVLLEFILRRHRPLCSP